MWRKTTRSIPASWVTLSGQTHPSDDELLLVPFVLLAMKIAGVPDALRAALLRKAPVSREICEQLSVWLRAVEEDGERERALDRLGEMLQ